MPSHNIKVGAQILYKDMTAWTTNYSSGGGE